MRNFKIKNLLLFFLSFTFMWNIANTTDIITVRSNTRNRIDRDRTMINLSSLGLIWTSKINEFSPYELLTLQLYIPKSSSEIVCIINEMSAVMLSLSRNFSLNLYCFNCFLYANTCLNVISSSIASLVQTGIRLISILRNIWTQHRSSNSKSN